MQKPKRQGFAFRPLIAFLVTGAFLVATVTGIILYVVPKGRIAFWIDWQLMGLDKEQWGNIHIIYGAIFIVTGIFHLYFNWKPFKSYLAQRTQGHLHLKKELITATILCVLVVVGAIAEAPPVSWVFDLNQKAKEIWLSDARDEPPFGHAEEVSLAAFTRRERIDLNSAVEKLEAAGFTIRDVRHSLKELARDNGTVPARLYAAIRELKERPAAKQSDWSPELIETQFAGTGLGRKTLAHICAETGIEVDNALSRLSSVGIKAQENMTFKEIAQQHHLDPMDILKAVLVPGYQP